MHPLEQQVLANWPQQLTPNLSYQVGLSGGVDSVVLLHILHQIKHLITDTTTFTLTAAHINHGISVNAATWEKFCSNYCRTLGIELHIIQHKVTKLGGESLENNARQIRYQAFFKSSADVIILAHQQNDQVETTLSQIFRGSDLHNIASMQELSQKHNKLIFRPLLGISRQQIENYAHDYQLNYITDESNSDTTYLRNFIRHEIIPKLNTFDKNIDGKVLKLPHQLQKLLALVDEVAASDFANTKGEYNPILPHEFGSNPRMTILLIDKFSALSEQRQINVLVYFLKQQQLPLPTAKQLNEFIRQALTSTWDKEPQLIVDKDHILTKMKQFIAINRK